MQSVLSLINAKDVGSHAVYPRASNVALSPPDGNEEASGSPLISSFPENSIRTPPSGEGDMKLSCFSAVTPVSGWNQCVKCVAPFSIAQFFISSATASATFSSRDAFSSIVFLSDAYTSSESLALITLSSNTSDPKSSGTFVFSIFSYPPILRPVFPVILYFIFFAPKRA